MIKPDKEKEIIKLYNQYTKHPETIWDFGNQQLYKMCKSNPLHEENDVIVGKVWLIGRSYAAAIERRKNSEKANDNFYKNTVLPSIKRQGKKLDEKIKRLKSSKKTVKSNITEILETHQFLMNIYRDISDLEKRSLASKYLHFHCPDKFFIYDKRAKNAINKFVQRPNKKFLLDSINFDKEYADFVCRMIELQEFVKNKTGKTPTPREIDSFLLAYFNKINAND